MDRRAVERWDVSLTAARSLPQFCRRGNLPLSLPSEQALTSEGLRSISRKHAESTALKCQKEQAHAVWPPQQFRSLPTAFELVPRTCPQTSACTLPTDLHPDHITDPCPVPLGPLHQSLKLSPTQWANCLACPLSTLTASSS